jgi:hypothetical protein
MTTNDRTTKVRAELERLFARSFREFFSHLEDVVHEALDEHAREVRSEYATVPERFPGDQQSE